jgi:hypothetical protein
MNEKAEKMASILISFLISLFLFLFACDLILQCTLLNPNYFRKQLSESHYYENALEEVENEFSSYASASGFDQKLLDSALDINDLQLSVNQSLNQIYGEGSEHVGTTDFESKLNRILTQNAGSRGVSLTEENKKSLQFLAKTCSDTYLQYISLPDTQELAEAVEKIRAFLKLPSIFIPALIAVLAAILFRINRWRHRALRACIYAVLGTMLMLAVFPAYLYLSGRIGQVSILSKSLYELTVSGANGVLTMFLEFALVAAAIAAILCLLYYRFRKKVSKVY